MYSIADEARIKLGVDVKGKEGFARFGITTDTRDSVIFLRVEGSDSEGVFEKLRVCHGKHWCLFLATGS